MRGGGPPRPRLSRSEGGAGDSASRIGAVGCTEQPETSPVFATHAADFEGKECLLAEKRATHVQTGVAEGGLSQQHPEDPNPMVHAQTVGSERDTEPGEPDTHEGAVHTQIVDVEPDSTPGEVTNPNIDAHAHFVRAEPETLMGEGEDWLYAMEESTGEIASVEEDKHPHIELQEPRVSHLVMREKARSLSLPSLPLPITPEAVRTQRSPTTNAGTLATPEPDCGADLEPPEAVGPPDPHLSDQIRASTEVGGSLKSIRGDALRRAMGQMSSAFARGLEGETPI